MVRNLFLLLAYYTVLTVVPRNILARPRDTAPAALTLSVFNDAYVPAEVIAQAEGRAGHILSQAGIEVEWLNCGTGGSHVPDQFEQASPCSSIAYPSHLSVRILLSVKSVRENILGEAFADSEGEGTYINLFYRHLAKSNAQELLVEGDLLGCVIAHEVGHLLLGTNSHGPEGIMQGRWEEAQLRDAGKDNLHFTQPQAASMRECLVGGTKRVSSRHPGVRSRGWLSN